MVITSGRVRRPAVAKPQESTSFLDGQLVRKNPMEFFSSQVAPQAVDLATAQLKSGWLSEGERTAEFEAALAEQVGLTNPVAVNSGTSALHLALVVANVAEGDEVILPPQTFVATGMAILMAHAKPVFADIDPATGNLSIASVKEKITERTKAVIPVHWAGYPCDLNELNQLTRQHRIAVIEDAAHALGASYQGRPIGAISRLTCFSFQSIKHLTTGDGGALCCLQERDFDEARRRRWFGIDRRTAQPSILGEREFDLTSIGYKYHMNDLAAAVGLGNLAAFPANLQRRRENAEFYRRELLGIPGLRLTEVDADRESSWWIFSMLVERREDFIRKLKASGIPSSVVHRRIDRFSVFGGVQQELAGQSYFDEHHIALPVHSELTADDLGNVVDAIQSGW